MTSHPLGRFGRRSHCRSSFELSFLIRVSLILVPRPPSLSLLPCLLCCAVLCGVSSAYLGWDSGDLVQGFEGFDCPWSMHTKTPV